MNSDTLSDVLQGVRLTGAVFFDLRACAPWAEASAAGHLIAPKLLPGVQHLISYHVIAEGTCWATLDGLSPLQLEAGDIIVFPHGDAHTMSSAPGMRAEPTMAAYDLVAGSALPIPFAVGKTGGSLAHVVCGFLGCDVRPFNPLLATLPRVLHIRDRVGATRGWLNQFVHVAVAESREQRAGGQSVLSRLSELMFVEAIRRHLETLSPEDTGWLAGLRDEAVGRALAALHRQPCRAWTLEDLAREAGASRSALAERFAAIVGQPPMQYLMQWGDAACGRFAGAWRQGHECRSRGGLRIRSGFWSRFQKAHRLLAWSVAWPAGSFSCENDPPAGHGTAERVNYFAAATVTSGSAPSGRRTWVAAQ